MGSEFLICVQEADAGDYEEAQGMQAVGLALASGVGLGVGVGVGWGSDAAHLLSGMKVQRVKFTF